VYTLLISIAVPDRYIGIFNIKGLIMMGLYLIGFVAALGTALILKWVIKSRERSYFIMELPVYRMPQWSVVAHTMGEKVLVFIRDAGKVIIAISILLWALSSYGPSDRFERLEKTYNDPTIIQKLGAEQAASALSAEKLRNSYAGILGHAIEPAIAPLGFDWKIGIALVTSFAAREVFVGTMATIYGASGDDDKNTTLRQRMLNDTNDRTGLPLFTLASSFALILFYAFAMQCMSTIAVVIRETGSWKWAAAQTIYMGLLAWLSAFAIYQLLS
jgi:ferrous iron transport protein B